MKTEAAILVELHRPLELAEIEIPRLNHGQVLVELKNSRICGSQIGEIEGVKGPDRWLPHLLGHEGGGDVVETGPGVKSVQAGDRVVLHWRPGNGIEADPPRYQWGKRTVNAGLVTTFNRYAVVSENRLTRIPVSIDYTTASLLADTLTTGFGIVNNDANLAIGESLVIIGCGGIGLGVVLAAKLAGAYPIIAVDLHAHKLQRALEIGATHTINSGEESLEVAVERILGRPGQADVVVDGTGNPAVIEAAYQLTHPQGRCVLFGVMPHDQRLSFHTLPLHFGKVLTGSVGGSSQPSRDIPRYVRMIEAGRFDPASFISHRIALPAVNEGIAKMRAGEVIHCVIDF